MELGRKYNADNLEMLNMETGILSSTLSMLEIYGLIEKVPGGFFIKK